MIEMKLSRGRLPPSSKHCDKSRLVYKLLLSARFIPERCKSFAGSFEVPK